MARRIGKFVVERALGAGSFATVWLAHDELLDDRVAIKVLAENWSRNDDVRRRFIDEAKILRRIDHDRVIRVHNIDSTEDGQPYFVMGWADRGSLHERLVARRAEGEPHEIDEAIALTIELLESLAVVHDFGVVHRDIKPSNLLFRTVASHERNAAQRAGRIIGDEMVVLGDFGLAKDLAGASGFTQAAGTPAYMAPEQSKTSSTIDHRADLYSVAAVMFELLTGETPFAANTLSDVREGRPTNHADSLLDRRPDLPPELAQLVDRGLSIDPAGRPATTDEMITLLRTIEPTPRRALIPGHTGAAGRVLDLIERGRDTLIASAELDAMLNQASEALGREVTSVQVNEGDEQAVLQATTADIVWTSAPFTLTTKPVKGTGPIVALDPAELGPEEAARLSDLLSGERAAAIQSGRSLAFLRHGVRETGSSDRQAANEMLDLIDELEQELPGLVELSTLRELTAGVVKLPRPLVPEFRRILLEVEPARRLGLDRSADANAVSTAAVETLDRWRGRLNEGRIPFAARPAVEDLITSLERLWSNAIEAS